MVEVRSMAASILNGMQSATIITHLVIEAKWSRDGFAADWEMTRSVCPEAIPCSSNRNGDEPVRKLKFECKEAQDTLTSTDSSSAADLKVLRSSY